MKILVTGAAGFIGYHLVRRLLDRGDEVTGLDSINSYYDVNLKYSRIAECGLSRNKIVYGKKIPSHLHTRYNFIMLDLSDREQVENLFENERYDVVCNLAAQAGVRYSLINPHAYTESNVTGFLNILEGCRKYGTGNLVYASSSSVYGLNMEMPFSVLHNVDHPVSMYAATKKANELMAHAYSHLYGLPSTGLRFFTVYGPWGRPDMALFLFTRAIMEGKPIDIYNEGNMMRDFTYIDDIIEGIIRVIDSPAETNPLWSGKYPEPSSSSAPYRLYNIGNGSPVSLMDFIEAIEVAVGKTAVKNYMPMQPGDVQATWADTSSLEKDTGYRPGTPLRQGVKMFVDWFRQYYGVDAWK